MIVGRTKTGVVIDWEDKDAMTKYIDDAWKKHLDGKLSVEDADITRFTRRSLTAEMASLLEKYSKLR